MRACVEGGLFLEGFEAFSPQDGVYGQLLSYLLVPFKIGIYVALPY